MVRNIVHDVFFLGLKSEKATKEDIETGTDLLDTLKANADRCVGLAANMIGKKKCIIAFSDGKDYTVMFNPRIIGYSEPYEVSEGCLSLDGERKTKRYRKIRVEWENSEFKTYSKKYEDFTAEIIQHEIDHTNGIVI